MESIRIIPDLEGKGLSDDPYYETEYTGPLIIGGLGDSTAEGKPIVRLAIEVEEGGWLVKQTTLSLFLDAADALKDKYGDPREE